MAINIASDEIYVFDPEQMRVLGMWESYNEDGWYAEEYVFRNGKWTCGDGALWTVEYDSKGNIIEGYKTLYDAYFYEHQFDYDIEITKELFDFIIECAS